MLQRWYELRRVRSPGPTDYSQNNQIISFFVRSGGASSNTNFVDYYIESGFNFTGFIPGRDNDVGGIAMARSHLSDDYSDSQVAQGNLM